MTYPHRIIPLLIQALNIMEDAQAHADAHDRATLGREIDEVRWSLGDLISHISDRPNLQPDQGLI
jgi:hypothetical protein